MNSLTYGWWLSDVYLYNDADHVVLGGYSEGENRSRVTSAVTTGIFIAGDDFSADGSQDGKNRALHFLTNKDINDIARSGRSFQPLYAAIGGKAADVFTRKDSSYFYLTLFNYGKEPKSMSIPLKTIQNIPLKNYSFKELWTGQQGNANNGIAIEVPAQDVRLLRFDLIQ
jgi:alpha-galactosidase